MFDNTAVCCTFLALQILYASGSDSLCLTKGCTEGAKLLLSAVNLTADPCEDFAAFACGHWKESKSSGGVSVTESAGAEVMNITTAELLKLTDSHRKFGSPWAKAATFFQQCRQYISGGVKPLPEAADFVLKFADWPLFNSHWKEENFNIAEVTGKLLREFGFGTILDTSVSIDYKLSNRNALYVQQAFLEQPKAKFDQENYEDFLHDYKKAMVTSLKSLAATKTPSSRIRNAEKTAQTILDFEISLATHIVADRDQLNPVELYNPISYDQLITQYHSHQFNWTQFFRASLNDNLFNSIRTNQYKLILSNPKYTRFMIGLLTIDRKRVIANYLLWRLIIHIAPFLGENFTDAAGYIKEQKLWLLEQAQVDSNRCTQQIIQYFEPITNRLLIDQVWSKELKQSALELANHVKMAIGDMLRANSWFSSTTISRALQKLSAMRVDIGYSDWIYNDTRLNEHFKDLPVIEGRSYFANFLSVSRWFVNDYYNDLLEAPRRDEFQIPSTTVNAQYLPWSNVIQIPVAELLSPNFNISFPSAINYGLTGFTVGHEMFHAFDDTGIVFNDKGTLAVDWLFSNDTLATYRAKTRCLTTKYDGVCFQDAENLCINGTATLGENLADNQGLTAAFKAFEKHLEAHKSSMDTAKLPGLERFGPQQLFFLSYAVGWCSEATSDRLKDQLIIDSHSPEATRINTVLSNSHHFSTVFQCKSGQKMFSENHCDVW